VVEFGAQPLGSRVTGIALSGEVSFAVVRIIGFFVISCVAAIAGGRSPRKLACDMTGGAIRLCVSSSQRELGKLGMIKECSIPGGRRMAERTVVRQPRFHMTWIGSRGKVFRVTTETVCRYPFELAANMAGGTLQSGMTTRQGKVGNAQMVKSCALPAIDSVASLTSSGQIGCTMVQACSLLIIMQVTRDTLDTQPSIDPAGCPVVAGFTLGRSVRPQQGETIKMVSNGLDPHPPTLHRMAFLTPSSELSAVEISMTIRAVHSYLTEDRIDMATRARYSFMHSPKRKASFGVVIEFGLGANRLPGSRGMTSLAGNRQRPMGIACPRRFGRLSGRCCCHQQAQERTQN
jgi:hypothetical protein